MPARSASPKRPCCHSYDVAIPVEDVNLWITAKDRDKACAVPVPLILSKPTDMDKRKIVHQLDTPFSAVQWPFISQEDQDVILELVCNLLSPLGSHRKSHITPSKGKRSKVRKRKHADISTKEEQVVPSAPEIAAYVDIGLSRITRNLQDLSSDSSAAPGGNDEDSLPGPATRPYSVIFVARSGQPSAFNNHFPQMVAVSSKCRPEQPPIRLVGFSKACEDRLTACLGIPRVSSIALREDAPQAEALVDFARAHVPPVTVPWLEQSSDGAFRTTKINSVQTIVGEKRQKK
ncbi:Rnase p and rnase mrp subunit [Pleurostoma richardsiae]|uniref:Rnase p and rnase mrp subunit n=1 Tax=Pleurostoma richardsiae TaxID=41990 RepID=A0AA38R7G1_9PEZI|nr:Rnase p and rnase mrp subunit [Pleurostoma richardsiae]